MAQAAYATFRPRATRAVCVLLAALTVVASAAMFARIAELEGPRTGERLTVVVLAVAILLFLYRQWSVRAVPSQEGLLVRNVVLTHRLEWAQIVSVRLGDSSWAQLDLSDGTVLAVMAIQRSDGERARAESRRLATLVAAHEGHGMGTGRGGG